MEPGDLVAIVLVLAAFIGCINQLWIKLPPAIGMLVGSLFLSLLVILSDRVFHLHVMHPLRGTLDAANLPHIFLDGILALLLFASSLHVNIAELRQRRWTILLLATASVILSTLVFGTAMWIVFRLVGATVSLAWCFVLGAILSPTDVVVVETPLRQVNLPPALRVAIVGESLFNDGAGVVLFLVALRVTQGETVSIGHGQVLATLVREIAGAAAIGFVAGRLAAWLIRLIKDEGLQLIVSLALVMGCYRLAILWDLSGPIAVVTAGLCMGSLAPRFGLSTETRPTLIGFWGLLDQLLTMMLFLLIGFQVLGLTVRPAEGLLVLFAIPLAVAARMISVAIPWGLTRSSLRDKARGVAVLTWAGLRGGISVALALALPASPWREDLLVVSYVVVVFTIVVQGLTMPSFLRFMHSTPPG